MTNYIATPNPWNLEPPPEGVLRQLAIYDDQLVLMPGGKEPVYRLLRRSPFSRITTSKDPEIIEHVRLNLVPVTSISNHPNWNELMQWLRDHDIWAHGGPEAATDQIEAIETRQRIDSDVATREDMEHLAAEAWFAAQLRSGEAVFVQDTRPETPLPDPASRPAAPDHAE